MNQSYASIIKQQQQIDNLNKLAYELRYSNVDQAFKLSQAAQNLSSQDAFATSPYHKGQADSFVNLSALHTACCNYDEALPLIIKAQHIYQKIDDKTGQGAALGIMGTIATGIGDYSDALAYALEAVKICEAIGDKRGLGNQLITIGLVYAYLDNHHHALTYYQKSLGILREINNQRGEVTALNNCCVSYCAIGDHPKALSTGLRALQICQDIGLSLFEAEILDSLGGAYKANEEYDLALIYFQESLSVARARGVTRSQGTALHNIGGVYQAQGLFGQAKSCLTEALDIAQRIGAKRLIYETHHLLAEAHQQLGQFELAMKHYRLFHEIKEVVCSQDADTKLKILEVYHRTEAAQQKAEIYYLKNVALEAEITERQRAEAEIRQVNQSLEQRVLERTGQLEAANQALKAEMKERQQAEVLLRQAQKMEAIGRLAGGVAHDFNNILTIIMGHTSLLMEELKTNLSLQADVARIQNASERAAALTRQLLAFSRQQVLEPQILNLNDTILQIETMLHRVMAENIVLVTKFEPSLSPIQVDPSQLDQVILNLVVNACDAMPRGGRLEIETQNVHLEACSLGPDAPKQAGAYVQLSVSDTGVGIDSALQPLIFDPFFTTKSQDQGSGLGLAVVHGIIQQSGGFICLDSEPAKGTTFKLYFPQIDALPENGQHPTASWTSLIGTEMILLVEDSEMIRHIVCQVLERYGYTVLVADSSQVALQFAKNHSYTIDLLLTDVVLSDEVSGPQLANQLQAIQPALPVLYMSGHTCDVTRNHDLLDPEAPFLQKPFTASTLVHHIRAVLDHPTQKP